ncbi:MAG: hypothetical protein HYX75_02900 [Acidobacteria bacterium]|nr:hypothetical protein [Acidobacteriota bacterium]
MKTWLYTRRVGIISLGLIAVACSTHMGRVNRAIREYDSSLTLVCSVESPELTIGQEIVLHLTLRNRRAEKAIAACVGVTRRYRFTAVPFEVRDRRPPVADSGLVVDHPYCDKPFSLGPGEELSWTEKVRVTDVGSGAAEVQASVSVVYPRDCEPLYGCYDTMIAAAPVDVTLGR